MTHVLIVEDDPLLRRSLTLNLTARGYSVDDTGNGEDALRLAGRHLPDVAFVDLGLPGISGLDVIRGMRAWSDVPIIVLSARGAERDKVEALDAARPTTSPSRSGSRNCSRRRVAERIGAALRPDAGPIAIGDLTIDVVAHRLTDAAGDEVRLTPIEWALLAHLAQRPGRLITQTELLKAVWGPEYETETNYLRVHIAHLRKKIEPDPGSPDTWSPNPASATASNPDRRRRDIGGNPVRSGGKNDGHAHDQRPVETLRRPHRDRRRVDVGPARPDRRVRRTERRRQVDHDAFDLRSGRAGRWLDHVGLSGGRRREPLPVRLHAGAAGAVPEDAHPRPGRVLRGAEGRRPRRGAAPGDRDPRLARTR